MDFFSIPPAGTGPLNSYLATVSLAIVLFADFGVVAQAQVSPPNPPCNFSAAPTVTCRGALQSGIIVTDPAYDTLIVEELTQTIAPNLASGIEFKPTDGGSISIRADTGTYGILIGSAGYSGIDARTQVSIVSPSGNSFIAGGRLDVENTGQVSTTSTGSYGIWAQNEIDGYAEAGDVEVAGGTTAIASDGIITTTASLSKGIFVDNFTQAFARNAAANTASATGGDVSVTTSDVGTKGLSATAVDVLNKALATTAGTGNAFAGGGATTTFTGSLTTEGEDADGVRVEAGASASVRNSLGSNAVATGGDVTVTSKDIATKGNQSQGIKADAAAVSTTDGNGYAEATGGALSVESTGVIATEGIEAEGILAVARAAASVTTAAGTHATADGSKVTVLSNDVTTKGNAAVGISAETSASSKTDGSAGNAEAYGGDISVTSSGAITTEGAGAYGIYASGDTSASSDGRADTTGGTIEVINRGVITTQELSAHGIYALAEAQAFVEPSGNDANVIGSNVTVTSKDVATKGDYAIGINAQSDATATTLGRGNAKTTSGNITVTSTGTITTEGSGAHGIEAWAYSFAASEDGKATTSSGDVKVTSNNIATTGDDAHGIYVENRVGAASIGAEELATPGEIIIESSGTLSATGDGSDGIRAWNHGDAKGDITVNVVDGSVTGGLGTGAAIRFQEGAANALNNYGAISALSQLAVQGSDGDETINNYGLITGNVDVGSGSNRFNNRAGGTFASASYVNLGASNALINDGDLTPGDKGFVEVTVIDGILVQTDSGNYSVDVDQSGAEKADRVDVTGTASFAGTITPRVIDISSPTGMVLIATASALSSSATAIDTGGYDFSLFVEDGTKLWLRWLPLSVLSLIHEPLTPNQLATAHYLDALLAGLPADLQPVLDILRSLPGEDIIAALDRLNGEHYLAQVNDTLQSSQLFVSSLMSCPMADGTPAVMAEGQCVWARVGGRTFDQDRTWTNIGGELEAWNVSAGAQVALQGNWRLGFAGSYEQIDLSTSNAAHSDGVRTMGGVVVKNRWGATSLALGGFGGYSWFDTTRTIGLAGIDAAHGEQDIAFGGVNARLSHLLIETGGLYVKPMVDLNATYIDYGHFTETGGGAANLQVQGAAQWVFSATPALELGAELELPCQTLVRPFVRAGITAFSDTDFTLTSSFLAAPGNIASFIITSKFDDVFADVAAGLTVLSADGVSLRVTYDGRFSDHSALHGGGAKLGVSF